MEEKFLLLPRSFARPFLGGGRKKEPECFIAAGTLAKPRGQETNKKRVLMDHQIGLNLMGIEVYSFSSYSFYTFTLCNFFKF